MNYFLYKNKTKISYSDTGNGNVIFLLHGFGETATIWNNQQDFLQKTHRVIIPNLPGSGLSELIEENDLGIDDYADCIYDLLQHLQLSSSTKISILGHSMGGYVTLSFVKKYANYIHSFGLIHSTAFADSTEKKQVRLRAIETIREYGSYSFLKTTIPNLFSNKSKQNINYKIDELIEQGKDFSALSLQQYYTAMMNREDSCFVLKESKLPVLFIAGVEDIAAPLSDVLQQVHLSEKVLVKILKDVGHMGMLEATKTVNETILKFVEVFNL